MAWVSLLASFGLSLILVPLMGRLSRRLGKFAPPRPDRWHKKPTPVLGGVGFSLAFTLAILLAALTGSVWGDIPWGMLAGCLIVFVLGLYDDLHPISPPAKLVGQILAAAAVIALGYTTDFFSPRIENSLIAQLPNILLTFVWLVGITNAINLLDNMDGLAGGISLITAAILSYFFWQSGSQGLLVVSLALAGAVLGFLVFNFPPASIFMGDSGSLFLGFSLAVLAIARQPQASNVFAVLGVPTLLFLLPILDTALVTITRLLRGQSPTQGGRDHTSHRLIAFGLNERQAVMVLYGVAFLAGGMAAALESIQYWFSLVLVPVLVLGLALLVAYLGGMKVVTSSSRPTSGFARFFLDLTYRRRILEILLDFALIGIAYYLAFLAMSSFRMNDAILARFLTSLPLVYLVTYLLFFLGGVYRGMWRYVGVSELVRFFAAAAGSALFVGFVVWAVAQGETGSPILFAMYGLFLFLAMAVSRTSFRILDQVSGGRGRLEANQRVLICGAGDEGEIALRWIQMNPHLGYRPVGFVDSDPFKVGRQIHGVEVLGGVESMEAAFEQRQVSGVIMTSDGFLPNDFGKAVIATCRAHNRWVRSLRLEFEPVDF